MLNVMYASLVEYTFYTSLMNGYVALFYLCNKGMYTFWKFTFLYFHNSFDWRSSLNQNTVLLVFNCLSSPLKRTDIPCFFWQMEHEHTMLVNFYRSIIESILTGGISVWYGNTTYQNRKAIQRVVKTVQRIIRVELPAISDLYISHFCRRAITITKDTQHPIQRRSHNVSIYGF